MVRTLSTRELVYDNDEYRARIGIANRTYEMVSRVIDNAICEAECGFTDKISVIVEKAANSIEVVYQGRGMPKNKAEGEYSFKSSPGMVSEDVYEYCVYDPLCGVRLVMANSSRIEITSKGKGFIETVIIEKGETVSDIVEETDMHQSQGYSVKFYPRKDVWLITDDSRCKIEEVVEECAAKCAKAKFILEWK